MKRTETAAREDNTEFWASQFARRWYRGDGHEANDFRRFAAAHRVPAEARAAVQERAREMLLAVPAGPRAA